MVIVSSNTNVKTSSTTVETAIDVTAPNLKEQLAHDGGAGRDVFSVLPAEQSVELGRVLERLESNDDEQILATIVQVKNLIIGNNKFKSFFLNDRLLHRLVELLNESKVDERFELVNQIIIMFGSYALGTLAHVLKLIQTFRLHEFLYAFLGRLDSKRTHAPTSLISASKNLILIESSLRCLSNMYTTAQLVPSLVYTLDGILYSRPAATVQSRTPPALTTLLNIFSLSNITKQTVINIIAISSSNLLVASINKPPVSFMNRSSHVRRDIESQTFSNGRSRVAQFRSALIQSPAIGQFATLLTHLQPIVQLNALKFYSAVCFENYEASMAILGAHYYSVALVELISAFLSGDNSIELQLYAAKCIVNLCRSTMGRLGVSSDLMDTQDEASVSPKASPADLVAYSSPLIKQRTLTTLVHLCYTCSTNYKTMSNGGGAGSLSSTLLIGSWGGFGLGGGLSRNRLSESVTYSANAFLLIQCLSTLTYLIELSSELQEKASHLEQIIATISSNISEACQALNAARKNPCLDRSSAFDAYLANKGNFTSIKHKKSQEHIDTVAKRAPKVRQRRSRRLRQLHAKRNLKQRQKNEQARQELANDLVSCAVTPAGPNPTLVYSSLFSSFYVKYNQFATKGIHIKVNEHQYRLTSSLNLAVSNLASSVSHIIHIGADETQRRLSQSHYRRLRQERRLLRPIKFLRNLNKSMNKALVAVSFHALAALACNNEEARRQISDFSGVMANILNCLMPTDEAGQHRETCEHTCAVDKDIDEEADSHGSSESSEESSENDDQESAADADINKEFDSFDELVEIETSDADLAAVDEAEPGCVMRFSALCLLHSLSRSVHQLRTKFLDQKIWHSLIELIQQARRETEATATERGPRPAASQDEDNEENEMIYSTKLSDSNNEEPEEDPEKGGCPLELSDEGQQNYACILTAIFSNLLLDFSPSKEVMFESGIIRILVELLNHRNLSVKLNCMWALMNMAFRAEQKVKQEILSSVTMEKLFQLLTEKDETLIMKTLGLLRNLISYRPHVDLIMNNHGTKVIQAMIMVLESDVYNTRIKEQALSILVNVADGAVSKEFIMDNEDLLRKINSFMTSNSVELQIAAVCCVANLVHCTDDGAAERQAKLKDMGAHRILQKLLQVNDATLLEKVKYALHQFSAPSPMNLGRASSSSSSSSTSINSSSAT